MIHFTEDVPHSVIDGEDGEIRVTFTWAPGHPGCMYLSNGDPGYPPEGEEMEIDTVFPLVDGKPETYPITLRDDQEEKLVDWLFENWERPDPGPDPDEIRDMRIDDELTNQRE